MHRQLSHQSQQASSHSPATELTATTPSRAPYSPLQQQQQQQEQQRQQQLRLQATIQHLAQTQQQESPQPPSQLQGALHRLASSRHASGAAQIAAAVAARPASRPAMLQAPQDVQPSYPSPSSSTFPVPSTSAAAAGMLLSPTSGTAASINGNRMEGRLRLLQQAGPLHMTPTSSALGAGGYGGMMADPSASGPGADLLRMSSSGIRSEDSDLGMRPSSSAHLPPINSRGLTLQQLGRSTSQSGPGTSGPLSPASSAQLIHGGPAGAAPPSSRGPALQRYDSSPAGQSSSSPSAAARAMARALSLTAASASASAAGTAGGGRLAGEGSGSGRSSAGGGSGSPSTRSSQESTELARLLQLVSSGNQRSPPRTPQYLPPLSSYLQQQQQPQQQTLPPSSQYQQQQLQQQQRRQQHQQQIAGQQQQQQQQFGRFADAYSGMAAGSDASGMVSLNHVVSPHVAAAAAAAAALPGPSQHQPAPAMMWQQQQQQQQQLRLPTPDMILQHDMLMHNAALQQHYGMHDSSTPQPEDSMADSDMLQYQPMMQLRAVHTPSTSEQQLAQARLQLHMEQLQQQQQQQQYHYQQQQQAQMQGHMVGSGYEGYGDASASTSQAAGMMYYGAPYLPPDMQRHYDRASQVLALVRQQAASQQQQQQQVPEHAHHGQHSGRPLSSSSSSSSSSYCSLQSGRENYTLGMWNAAMASHDGMGRHTGGMCPALPSTSHLTSSCPAGRGGYSQAAMHDDMGAAMLAGGYMEEDYGRDYLIRCGYSGVEEVEEEYGQEGDEERGDMEGDEDVIEEEDMGGQYGGMPGMPGHLVALRMSADRTPSGGQRFMRFIQGQSAATSGLYGVSSLSGMPSSAAAAQGLRAYNGAVNHEQQQRWTAARSLSFSLATDMSPHEGQPYHMQQCAPGYPAHYPAESSTQPASSTQPLQLQYMSSEPLQLQRRLLSSRTPGLIPSPLQPSAQSYTQQMHSLGHHAGAVQGQGHSSGLAVGQHIHMHGVPGRMTLLPSPSVRLDPHGEPVTMAARLAQLGQPLHHWTQHAARLLLPHNMRDAADLLLGDGWRPGLARPLPPAPPNMDASSSPTASSYYAASAASQADGRAEASARGPRQEAGQGTGQVEGGFRFPAPPLVPPPPAGPRMFGKSASARHGAEGGCVSPRPSAKDLSLYDVLGGRQPSPRVQGIMGDAEFVQQLLAGLQGVDACAPNVRAMVAGLSAGRVNGDPISGQAPVKEALPPEAATSVPSAAATGSVDKGPAAAEPAAAGAEEKGPAAVVAAAIAVA